MSYYRRLIEESEKKRILGLHNKNKENPTKRLISEAVTDFPACVRYAGKEVTLSLPQAAANIMGSGYDGTTQLNSIYVIDPSTKYTYYWVAKPKVVVYAPTDPNANDQTKNIQVKSYHCGCKDGKLKPISRPYDGKDIKDEVKCEGQGGTGGAGENQQGTTPGGQQGGDCSKGPMDLAVSMGLNWKETRQKWIDAKCNGTTPCILGDATTNINLRNALCKGTWNPKTGGGAQTPTGEKPKDGEQLGTEDKKYSEEYIVPTFGQTPKAD